jgi:Flp pilus assembly protein TadD
VDPRLTFPTPYRNVHPDVKYVGDRACADCHVEQCDSYRHHPMGQALAPLAAATPIERYDPAARDPFAASGLHYEVRRRQDRVWHHEWAAGPDGQVLAESDVEAHFAIGSGARARSYAIDRDGYLFQSPVTWYPERQRWDLSPGYEVVNRHFARPIGPTCLFCHSNYADYVPHTVNRFRQPIFQGYAIGCERCHGPGELHVRRREAGEAVAGLDDTIVNPARLEHSLREAVCQQCHIQGEQRILCRGRADFDYRPGLPLHLFLMDFIDGRDQRGGDKFVSSVEQVMASRCYRASREPKKLGCISCHDAHRHPAPEEKVAHYRKNCLQCHTDRSCSLSPAERRARSPEDSCIACHMPRTGSEVSHTMITDHSVPRRPPGPTPSGMAHRSTPGPDDLVPFHRHLVAPQDEEVSRNLGLAMLAMLDHAPPDAVARQYAEKALPLLERALERDRHDWPVLESRGSALWWLGRREEALADYETVLSTTPQSEQTLHLAGDLALALKRPELARSYLERAVRVNPWRGRYYHGLAVASFRRGEWDRAVGECRQALQLEPSDVKTRSLVVQCHLAAGRGQDALAEFAVLREMTPADRRQDLRLWFEERLGQLSSSGGTRHLP